VKSSDAKAALATRAGLATRTGIFPLPVGPAVACMMAAGILYWLGFPTKNMWPFAFVTFVPFYLGLYRQTPRRALFLGLIAGLVMTCLGFYWLFEMLRTFSGFPKPLCMLFVLIINAYQGGRFALQGWLFARGQARGWSAPLVFGASFVASELLFPLLFPWYFAACIHSFPVLAQSADLGGPILVGLLLLVVNVAIAEIAVARLTGRPFPHQLVRAGAITLTIHVAYGIVRMAMIDKRMAESEAIKVGYVQGNMGLFQKREDPGEGLRRHKRLTAELKAEGADLVVWSESSVTFAVPEPMYKPFMKARIAEQLGMPAIFGAVVYRTPKDKGDRERWFNTALVSNEKGDITGRYDKQFLLAFGEYLPFGDTFPKLYEISPNSGRFSKGDSDDSVVLELHGKPHAVTMLICYEDILTSFTNRLVRKGNPELLVNITNDAWFGDTSEPWEHLALAKFRAIEHRRFLVRSTNSGVSAIVDAAGRTLVQSGTFTAERGMTTVRLMRSTTLYELVGDAPWWIVSLGSLVLAFRRRRNGPVQNEKPRQKGDNGELAA
jgi:apolipoprotein N-acyltransferase